MSRVKFGLDGYMDPADVSSMQEQHDRRVLHRVAPHVMKLYVYDAAGAVLVEASAFTYGEHPYVFTVGHAQHAEATRYELVDSDLVHHHATMEVAPDPLLDGMLLKTESEGGTFSASNVARGDTVYALGFPPGSEELAMSKGMVSSTAIGAWIVDAHADHGWSGGVVVNRLGQLVGMIQGGDGCAVRRVRAISAEVLHNFALRHGKPGFKS